MTHLLLAGLVLLAAVQVPMPPLGHDGALDGVRHRVLVSTDIGGTDPDDFQSMVHLLLYADVLDIEGLVSSPYGPGRREHILEVIDRYEQDYPALRRHSSAYPTPDVLRALTKQGETEVAPYSGVRRPTEGSRWIVARARHDDPRPLHVLVWGGLEDLAQALADAPDIAPRLRVYFIGGPNKKWSPDAYHSIVTRHPDLWMIEANATYRGWFTGGLQQDEWENTQFVRRHVAGHGALGDYFAQQLEGTIKMGDTPSVARLLRGTPGDPEAASWGGRYVRAWNRPYVRHDRLTTEADRLELFGILELALPVGPGAPRDPDGWLIVENQRLRGQFQDGRLHFRFAARDPKVFRYRIESNAPALDAQTGAITVQAPDPARTSASSPALPHWWTDDPRPDVAEGIHHGARTVSRWRQDALRDFADRLDRTRPSNR